MIDHVLVVTETATTMATTNSSTPTGPISDALPQSQNTQGERDHPAPRQDGEGATDGSTGPTADVTAIANNAINANIEGM